MMPDGLYERDALEWALSQAALLRCLAAGERVNDAVDWPHVIEELEDVGLSQLRACRSSLRHAATHIMKLHAWPDSQAASHWRGEVRNFLDDAQDRFAPSMRQHIGLDELYERAAHSVRADADDSAPPRPLPDRCALSLDDLLASRPDVPALVGRFGGTPDGQG